MLTLQRLKDIRKTERENSNIIISQLLATIIGECEQISKTPTHNDILNVITKIYKDNESTIKISNRSEVNTVLKQENDFLQRFLPSPLTEKELTVIINSQIQAGCGMSAIMKYLSENYKGRYDGKSAAKLCNSLINELK